MTIHLVEGDDEVRELLKHACKRVGGKKSFAKMHGIHHSTLTDMVNGRKILTDRVARTVGYERVVIFRAVSSDG